MVPAGDHLEWNDTVIQLDNLGVTYGDHLVALQAISLTLNQGEFAVVLGPSGAGKTTLLRCINCLTRPTSGQVSWQGRPDLQQPRHWREHRKHIGMIFQQHQLIGRQTALQNVLVGRLAYHSTWRSLWPLPQHDQMLALECLERVNLLDQALTPVKFLSGGQQQRVGIARALAQQPRFILADEPVASLDPNSSSQVLTLLRQICQTDGVGAFVSLHQVELAQQYGDRIIGLFQGKVIFDGPPGCLDPKILEQIYTGKRVLAPS